MDSSGCPNIPVAQRASGDAGTPGTVALVRPSRSRRASSVGACRRPPGRHREQVFELPGDGPPVAYSAPHAYCLLEQP